MSTVAPPRLTVQDRIRMVVASPVALASYLTIDGRDGPIPLELWDHQVEALRLCRTYPKVTINKARQLGVTWGVVALLGLHDCIAYPVGETAVFSLDDDEAKLTVWRVKRLYSSAPDWLHAAFPIAVDKADKFGIQHPEGESSVVSFAASGESGRGRTFRRVLADERARWKKKMGAPAAAQRMAAIRPTVADGGGSMVEVSTPDGRDGHYKTWMGAVEPGEDVSKGNGYVRTFFGALSRPDRTLEQVNAWRQALDADEPGLGAQEYPYNAAESFRASGSGAFDVDSLDLYRENSCELPERVGQIVQDAANIYFEDGPGWWKIWEAPRPGHSYMISADSSGGHGADYSAAKLIDLVSLDQVGSFHAKVEPAVLARELWKAGYLYAGPTAPALLVPESNNHGQAVVALLAEWGYENLFEQEVYDKRTRETTRRLGYATTPTSRPFLISSLQSVIREGTVGIRDVDDITEMEGFVWVDTPTGGRYEAGDGGNDDRVMAWAIAAAVLTHSPRTEGPSDTPVIFPGEG